MSLLFDAGGTLRPAPRPRAPLPPLDTTGNPVTTWPGPLGTGKRAWRENAWSITLPGLPWLPNLTSSRHPERCLTWFLGHALWASWVDKILTAAAERGYTHFTLSWPDCRDSCGMTVQTFTALAAYVKSWGFYVHIKWWAKVSNTTWNDPQNSDWPTMQAWVTPILSSLIAAKAVDAVSPWEWNANNIAGPQGTDVLDGVAALVTPAGVDAWLHFGPECVWWGAPDSNRDQFWADRVAAGHIGLHYQINPAWDPGTRQARMQDTTNHQGFVDTGALFCLWETDASIQFDGDQPDEDHSDADNYVGLCAPGLIRPCGFGGGARMPDGSVI